MDGRAAARDHGLKITACILARNEEKRIEDALKSLQGWTDQVIVIDNESTDGTVGIARRYGALILTAPQARNFDAARNLAIEHATGDWIFYLDADERVPTTLGPILTRLIAEHGHEFEALVIPFRTFFCGTWIQHSGWWPGYTRPQLLKKGRFHYEERLHAGVSVDGHTTLFPPDNPDLAILHYSYDSIEHYISKINLYTDGEAQNLYEDSGAHTWEAQIAHFVFDWQYYYDRKQGHLDRMPGFILAYMSAFYRFLGRAKLWDMRRKRGEAFGDEPVPKSVADILSFMETVARDGAEAILRAKHRPVTNRTSRMPTDWLSSSTPMVISQAHEHPHVTITGCILARNEAGRIAGAIESLATWTNQIIVIDNESDDETARIARELGALVISAPRAENFDGARNLAVVHATGDWIFYLDADERVPERLGPVLRTLIHEHGDEFEGLLLPFKTYMFGTWIKSPVRWPGYCRPQLLKKGAFEYRDRLHGGVQVNGRAVEFPASDSDLAVIHNAVEDIHQYINKMNAYTSVEAVNLLTDQASHCWQTQIASFLHEWHVHYDVKQAYLDGMPGFLISMLASLYRLASFAKLWDIRRERGETDPSEPVPASLAEIFALMRQVLAEGPARHLRAAEPRPKQLIWIGPVRDDSDHAEDGRNLVLGLHSVEEPVAVLETPWGEGRADLTENDTAGLDAITIIEPTTADILVVHGVPGQHRPSRQARVNIARTQFESDRINPEAARALNAMDRIWVPSEFNRRTFMDSGVEADRIAVVPAGISAAFFTGAFEPWWTEGRPDFQFVSAINWTMRQGWDVLLASFASEFSERPNVGLHIQVQDRCGRSSDEILAQADAVLSDRCGKRLADCPQIHISCDALSKSDLARMLRSADAFVLPTRGEGWCYALMMAMAAGLPTIATGWSGHTAYHSGTVGYPLKYKLEQAPPALVEEVPSYSRHMFANPDEKHLCKLMRLLTARPASARQKAKLARELILLEFSREKVAAIVRNELALCRKLSPVRRQQAPDRQAQNAASAAIVQSAAGEHTRLLDLTRAHHQDYAKAHRMDYICRYGPQQTERSPLWDKIPLLLEILRSGKYEHIIWIDADAMITDRTRDLRLALPDGYWLGMVHHGNPPYFNNGVMYLRNTPDCTAFLEEVWKTWPVDHGWEDNAAVIKVWSKDPMRWSGIAVLEAEWNSTYRQNECSNPVVKAWHGYGDARMRYQLMLPALQSVLKVEQASAIARASTDPGTGAMVRAVPIRPSANLLPTDAVAPVDFIATLGRKLRLVVEGDQTIRSSLGHVNREITCELISSGDIEISLTEAHTPWHQLTAADDPRFAAIFDRIGAGLSGEPDVTLRHRFPANWTPPPSGKFVMMQPWESSHLPGLDWIQGATHFADEVWANSRFVRDVYVRSGVPAEKVYVVPEGVRTDVFTPVGPHFPLATNKRTRFLFVGGALHRKGADLLLESYLRAFGKSDDVCLVIKDMATNTFYKGQTWAEGFRRAQSLPDAAQIIYMDEDLDAQQLASLYRTCTCVVLPYRGEGFGLPPLEGMACGIPPIVTAGGSTDDYVDDATGLRVPFHKRIEKGKYVGPHAIDSDPWMLEPDLDALVDALRWVHEHADETKERGRAAREHVVANWGWERAAAIVRTRMHALTAPERAETAQRATPWFPKDPEVKVPGKPKATRKKVEISLCMIVRNEEARIADCLRSAASHVDEIVVVDTGSIDRTREIAYEYGARVFEMPWIDNFAAARNQSIEQATGLWIFWMDADDVLPAECGKALRDLIKRHPKRDAAFQIHVRIPPGPNESSPSAVDHVKLFPKLPELLFDFHIHEQIVPALKRKGIQILPTDLYVVHANYDRSPAGQVLKRRRDFRALALDLAEKPNHPFVLFCLGMTHLFATREYEVAAHYLRRSINLSHPRDSIVRKAYALLGTARTCQMQWKAAADANEEGRREYPDDAELLFQASQIYQQLKRPADAEAALRRLMDGKDERHYRSVDMGLRTYRGTHELALLYGRTGDLDRCLSALEAVVATSPEYMPAQIDLVETLCGVGRSADAASRLACIPVTPATEAAITRLTRLIRREPPADVPNGSN